MGRLTIDGLHTFYGAIEALKGVSLTVSAGEIVALIGANGAGKTTLLTSIFGNPVPRAGSVKIDGGDITGLPGHEIARHGIAIAPEGRRVFARLTVLENLQMGAWLNQAERFERNLSRVFDLFPRLKERAGQRAGTMSGGEQQMLAIGRALMSEPTLLLLDEPSLGLAPIIVKQIFSALLRLNREEGCTILLAEQDAFHALKMAHRAYVLVNGQITLSGAGRDLLDRPEIRAAYLEGGVTH